MRHRPFIFIPIFPPVAFHAHGSTRTSVSVDAGWRFFKGDAPGAEAAAFDDSKWGIFITTPHIEKEQAAVHVQGTVANQSENPRQVGAADYDHFTHRQA